MRLASPLAVFAFLVSMAGSPAGADMCCVCSDGRCVEGVKSMPACLKLCNDNGLDGKAYRKQGSCSTGGCRDVSARLQPRPAKSRSWRGGGK
jgi:hypothetical protein